MSHAKHLYIKILYYFMKFSWKILWRMGNLKLKELIIFLLSLHQKARELEFENASV